MLEEELINLQTSLRKMASMIDLLVDDNKKLREHIVKRDRDTAKL